MTQSTSNPGTMRRAARLVWRADRGRFYARFTDRGGRVHWTAVSDRLPARPARVPQDVQRRLAAVTVAGRGRCTTTLGTVWDAYIPTLAARAAATVTKRTAAWGRLKAALGAGRRLDDVTEAEARGYLAREAARGVRVQALHDLGLLKHLLELGARQGYIEASPLARFALGRPRSAGRALTAAEAGPLLACADTWAAGDPERTLTVAYYRLLMLTGSRPGEARSLTWFGVCPVEVTLPVFKRKGVTKRVPMTSALESVLETIRGVGAPNRPGCVFGWWGSDGAARRRLGQLWKEWMAAAGVEGRFRPHDARHTVGTEMTLRAGLGAASIALGHASTRTTERTYYHPEGVAAAGISMEGFV